MLSFIRPQYERFFAPIGLICQKLGFTPNSLTIIGIVIGSIVVWTIPLHWWFTTILLILISVLFDVADGATARATGKHSHLGELFDHCSDRYVEFFIICGIAREGTIPAQWPTFVIFGMVMASYVRAKAEANDPQGDYKFGLAERQEKIFILILGFFGEMVYSPINWLLYSILLVGVLSHLTVIQRLVVAYQRAKTLGKRN